MDDQMLLRLALYSAVGASLLFSIIGATIAIFVSRSLAELLKGTAETQRDMAESIVRMNEWLTSARDNSASKEQRDAHRDKNE